MIQRNAFLSWTLLRPTPEIIVIGNESGTAEVAAELNLIHCPDVHANEYGTPLVSSIFEVGEKVGSGSTLVYVNADIILMSDLTDALSKVRLDTFLMVGQRCNLDVRHLLDFLDPSWELSLQERVSASGQHAGVAAIDYFVFTRGLGKRMPDLAIGRIMWDNYFIWRTKSRGIPIIDATQVVTAVHQNHDYKHLPGELREFREGPEARKNIELAGGWVRYRNLEDADWLLTNIGLVEPPLTVKQLLKRLERLMLEKSESTFLHGFVQRVLHPDGKMKNLAKRIGWKNSAVSGDTR